MGLGGGLLISKLVTEGSNQTTTNYFNPGIRNSSKSDVKAHTTENWVKKKRAKVELPRV